ncbi:MAG: alpha-ribazole phosphatase [Spirochaetes bacterium]|nr:alpha-ribazole phosphatase [Spirochaetota bacterium]
MAEILLIRHGETDYNKNGKFGGKSDIDLNKQGREQARFLSEYLKDEKIDHFYSSDLKRCVNTGDSIICSGEKIYCKDFREMSFGNWEGMTYDEIKEKHPFELEEWENDWIYKMVPGGESFTDMSTRVISRFEEILGKHIDSADRIALVTHSGCIRAILGHYIAGSLKNCWKFHIDNASVSRLKCSGDYVYLKSLNEKRYN